MGLWFVCCCCCCFCVWLLFVTCLFGYVYVLFCVFVLLIGFEDFYLFVKVLHGLFNVLYSFLCFWMRIHVSLLCFSYVVYKFVFMFCRFVMFLYMCFAFCMGLSLFVYLLLFCFVIGFFRIAIVRCFSFVLLMFVYLLFQVV